ncbi:ATP-binding protein [Streptomyces sp. NPDC006703]|uniref:ATP-binding protein n=1 Tax=Streptomyces sp. NPDC006703 TaxID=3364759 RepID=UPI00369969EA
MEWIGRAENLVIAGASGTGKSHFTEGLAQAAIEKDLRVSWFTHETRRLRRPCEVLPELHGFNRRVPRSRSRPRESTRSAVETSSPTAGWRPRLRTQNRQGWGRPGHRDRSIRCGVRGQGA